MQIKFYLTHLKNLLRKPTINYTKKQKITIKNAGIWGEKYISPLDVYVLGDVKSPNTTGERL